MTIPQNFNSSKCMGKKKVFSYASLIAQALLNSPENRLTLKEIYNYILINYPELTERKKGWQNSIRHNLSLNKAFFKEPKMKGTPGKGSYWTINHSEAKMLINKADTMPQVVSRLRKSNNYSSAMNNYNHPMNMSHPMSSNLMSNSNGLGYKKSPFLDEIQITDEPRIKTNYSVFNGHLNDGRLNPFNSSLEAYFGIHPRPEQEEDDEQSQNDGMYKTHNISDYFRFE